MNKEKKIAELMKNLSISREEALQVMADDEAIDHGAKLFELSADQKKAEKKMKNYSTKTPTPAAKREKKEDTLKDEVYSAIFSSLSSSFSAATISGDDSRIIEANIDGRKFKITIACPRS